MAAPYARNMPFAATYWPPAGNDGFGGTFYGPPEERACRWQDKAVMFRDREGREVVAKSVVYVSAAVESGGKLLLGVSLEDEPPETAREIRQVDVSPDLGGVEELHKAYL